MLKDLRFPLIYLLEAVLFLPLMAGFVAITSFLAARPRSALDLKGKSLPSNWEAAVPSHGNFLQGYLVSRHPLVFTASVAILAASGAALYRVHLAQSAQHAAADRHQLKLHSIARACVFVVWALLGYLLVTRLLVGISPPA